VKVEEIDQKQLKNIRQRFIQLSELRFQRMESSLSPIQADHLKLLPLLFHVNHPMLPGYVDKFVPCGLPNYSPTAVQKSIAKTVSQSFEYKPRAHLKYPISALYLMGSMGTLGQSTSSDIDLWICLSDPLEGALYKKLKEKANNIKDWLNENGIELNFYLVNSDDFSRNRNKQIESDHCGNTQNFLLLDEFYRTAVWFAGRWPLWWLVPTDSQYTQYSQRLLKQKHIDSADWIDFGEVKQIPANEYFSAALWQLYKAIQSPYKSSVKLLVLESYAKLFPCAGVLSNEFKNLVYDDFNAAKESDPYLSILVFAEEKLQDNPQRLEFLRRSFYLKTNVKVNLKRKTKLNWRQQVINSLVKKWGWNQSRLDYLNSRHQWSVNRVIEERKDLVRELTQSYHFLSNFARIQGVINNVTKSELLSLGRKLYAAFERRNGKVELLNNGIAKDIFEASVTINHDSKKGWQFYLSHLNKKTLVINQPIYTSESLFNCLCWGCANYILTNDSLCQIYSETEFLDHQFAKEMITDIARLLNQFDGYNNKINFSNNSKIVYFGLFLNTRTDPLQNDKLDNLYRVVSESDCLSWTENKINLAGHFDMVAMNSWGELSTQHFSGESALIDFFKQYRKSLIRAIDNIPIFCRGLIQNEDIAKRVRELLVTWSKLSIKSQKSNNCHRYLMLIGKKWLAVHFFEGKVEYQIFSSQASLLLSLSENHKAIEIDSNSDIDSKNYINFDSWLNLSSFIQSVLKRRLSDHIDCFIEMKSAKLIEFSIKIPNGTVFFQSHKNTTVDQLVGHYQQFFDNVQNRISLDSGISKIINYYSYEKIPASNQRRLKKIDVKSSNLYQQFSLVQAIGFYKNSRLLGFNLYTTKETYLYSEYAEQVYPKLVKELLAMRKRAGQYPIFLTDIDLSETNEKASLMELLRHKRLIEEKLNRVMKALSRKSSS